tara:strand:+ start:21 stop:176 length:156 start_codon:yes stop_codon:yes gene_type:complete
MFLSPQIISLIVIEQGKLFIHLLIIIDCKKDSTKPKTSQANYRAFPFVNIL